MNLMYAYVDPSAMTLIVQLIVWGILLLCVYFIPAIVAKKKKHSNKTAILLLNIFLGWTLVGWVVSLVWAVKKPPVYQTINYNITNPANVTVETENLNGEQEKQDEKIGG